MLASLTKPNVIDHIYYDFDRATLRPESRSALDSLAQVLRDNPNVTIELAAHTDRVGSDDYNNNLSQRRAQSVIDYLIKAGIAADRLTAQVTGRRVQRRLQSVWRANIRNLRRGMCLRLSM
jgi:peptidoglycan-associated lipoprotein